MLKIKVQHPFVYDDGTKDYGLIKHYLKGYTIIQNETGNEYCEEAIDSYPCKFTYSVGKPIEEAA